MPIGGEICSFRVCCPQKCPHFWGLFHVFLQTLQYQTQVFKLINWRCEAIFAMLVKMYIRMYS